MLIAGKAKGERVRDGRRQGAGSIPLSCHVRVCSTDADCSWPDERHGVEVCTRVAYRPVEKRLFYRNQLFDGFELGGADAGDFHDSIDPFEDTIQIPEINNSLSQAGTYARQ